MTETWDTIADWYAQRVRSGSAMHRFSRDALLRMLPADLSALRVLDLGCGEGIVSRAVAARGAVVTGVDPSPQMIDHARRAEREAPTGARFAVDDGCVLATVETRSVDWVTAALSLNNVPDLDAALRAVHRVLVPGGGLVFTVPHPCFEAPHAGWTDGDDCRPARRVVGDYLIEGFWRSANPEGARRAGNRHRTFATYLNALVRHGFRIEVVEEPAPDTGVVAEQPRRAALPPFAVIRAGRG